MIGNANCRGLLYPLVTSLVFRGQDYELGKSNNGPDTEGPANCAEQAIPLHVCNPHHVTNMQAGESPSGRA
jgi:hypothetical protein